MTAPRSLQFVRDRDFVPLQPAVPRNPSVRRTTRHAVRVATDGSHPRAGRLQRPPYNTPSPLEDMGNSPPTPLPRSADHHPPVRHARGGTPCSCSLQVRCSARSAVGSLVARASRARLSPPCTLIMASHPDTHRRATARTPTKLLFVRVPAAGVCVRHARTPPTMFIPANPFRL